MEKKQFKGVPESNWVVGPCQTEEIAKQVLAVAHAYGWKWGDNTSFTEKNMWQSYEQNTCYWLKKGEYAYQSFYKNLNYAIISPETFLANNPMPEEKPEQKTRKPGVKYTLEDWKKEADTCRKRAEYWKNKFQEMETRHFAQTGSLLGEMDAINEEIEAIKAQLTEKELHLKWAHQANTTLQDSNVELRGANDEMIQSLDHLRERLELQTKGVQALEEDAKLNRMQYQLLLSDFETKNSELEIMEEDYNALKNNKKHTTVLAWVGWIMFFVCLFGFIFLK